MNNELTPQTSEVKTPEQMRGKILQLEAAMMADPSNHITIEPKHYFAESLYGREIFIPKDTLLTGKIHKTEHLCVLALGEVSVLTENGMKRIKAPSVVHSMPGIKRVLFAHEDSVWINFHHHPTNERDLEKIEDIFTVKTFEELGCTEVKKLQGGE